ncbi:MULTISPECIES: DUF2798 domain-containing protein [Halioglobus]|nr:DUF2798 domain-containing protein [Halioglobus japonicus]
MSLIPKKYTPLVFSFFMSLLMSCLMSLIICLLNFGLIENILLIWLKSWGTAFLIAYPVVLLINPLVSKLVNLVIKD